VASTLNSDQLMRMPTPTRNALNTIAFLPGVNTRGDQPRLDDQRPAGGVPEHHARRREQQRQLPAQLDGFFASVTPRQDAVEAVAVTLAPRAPRWAVQPAAP